MLKPATWYRHTSYARDIDPRDANKHGDDYSICGNCKHRGTATDDPTRKLAKNRSCYVNIGQGVLIVWKAFQRGAYDAITGHDNIAAIGAGRMVRLGTYGDPSAVPAWIWESLLSQADGWTGYSHQADVTGADYRPDMVMRSADTEQEARDAWQNGERTFSVVANVSTLSPDVKSYVLPVKRRDSASNAMIASYVLAVALPLNRLPFRRMVPVRPISRHSHKTPRHGGDCRHVLFISQ